MNLGMHLGPHALFIVGAYAAAALILGTLVVWIVLDYRHQRRTLADLESRGISRRSAATERPATERS